MLGASPHHTWTGVVSHKLAPLSLTYGMRSCGAETKETALRLRISVSLFTVRLRASYRTCLSLGFPVY